MGAKAEAKKSFVLLASTLHPKKVVREEMKAEEKKRKAEEKKRKDWEEKVKREEAEKRKLEEEGKRGSGKNFNFLLQVHCCCGSPSVQVQIEGSQFCSSCTTSSAPSPCRTPCSATTRIPLPPRTSPRPHRRSSKEWAASNCPATSGAGSQQRRDAAVCQRHARPAVPAVCYASSAQSCLDEPDVCATV